MASQEATFLHKTYESSFLFLQFHTSTTYDKKTKELEKCFLKTPAENINKLRIFDLNPYFQAIYYNVT